LPEQEPDKRLESFLDRTNLTAKQFEDIAYQDVMSYDERRFGVTSYPVKVYLPGQMIEIHHLPPENTSLWCPLHGDDYLCQSYVEYGKWYINRHAEVTDCSDNTDTESDGGFFCDECGYEIELHEGDPEKWIEAILDGNYDQDTLIELDLEGSFED
jgi:hypothetical protein